MSPNTGKSIPMKDLITPRELSVLLKCHLHSVYRIAIRHQIKFYRLPGVGIRFSRKDIEQWIKENEIEAKEPRELIER